MDVNEQIAIAWLTNVKKMFVRPVVFYGQYHSDIDILAIEAKDRIVWDCEVKVRTGSTNMDKKSCEKIIQNFANQSRKDFIQSVIGDDWAKKKMLLISQKYLGERKKTIENWAQHFEKNSISVLFFESIMDELIDFAISCPKSSDPILQTLRLASHRFKHILNGNELKL